MPPGEDSTRSKAEREALRAGGTNMLFNLTHEDPPDHVRSAYGDWESFHEAKERVYETFAREADRLVAQWHDDQPAQFEDALVVAVGDHGQLFGTDGFVGHHCSLHPKAVQVPLVVDPPADWETPDRTITTPVSLAGLGRALIDVVAGEVETTDGFIQAVATYSHEPSGSVVVCADGPTWSLPPLYEEDRLENDLIDDMADRRVACIHDEYVDVYRSPRSTKNVEAQSYTYTAEDREPAEGRNTPPVPTSIEPWLTRTEQTTDQWDTVDERLETLGYA